jgi:preprotein translocase subunit SecE
MAMNREQKRAMQRAGQLNADGSVAARDRKTVGQNAKEPRTSPQQFFREVRAEMKKVAWPTRAETIRLAIIVFITIVVLGAFIFFVDLGFARVTDFLFPSTSSSAATAALPFF